MAEPMTPPACDLRGLPFMPLDVIRLTDSDLCALSTGDEFKAAITLWCKAWLQVPAASLPNDDRILAHLSGAGSKWRKVRAMALRGFVLCDDGRLYHPVIAEKANDAWERRGEWQEKQNNKTERQQRWRARVKEISAELREMGVTPPTNAQLSTLERLLVDTKASTRASTAPSTAPSTVDARETALTGTGTGTLVPLDKSNGAEADPDKQFWDMAKGYLGPSKASLIGRWVSEHGREATAGALAAAQVERAVDPVQFVVGYFRKRAPPAGAERPIC